MSIAALVLAGGASRRMGRDKLSLPRNGGEAAGAGGEAGVSAAAGSEGAATETVLSHVVKVAAEVADVVYLVIPPETVPGPNLEVIQAARVPVITHHDKASYRGPLQALNGVWPTLESHDAIFVVPGDLPGLTPRVLRTCNLRLDVLPPEYDGAAVVRGGRWQPLLACYKPVAGQAWRMAEQGETRILRALDSLKIAAVDEQLQAWPAWWTRPIHTPEDYEAWLQWQHSSGA